MGLQARIVSAILFVLFFLPEILYSQGQKPVVNVLQINGKISIDGILDEEEWSRASAIDSLKMVELIKKIIQTELERML